MKEIKKRTTNETTMFVCEICKQEYNYKRYAMDCEKQHNCKHINKIYNFIDSCDDCRRFNTNGIECTCKDCGNVLGEVMFEDYEDDDEIKRKIYDLIK